MAGPDAWRAMLRLQASQLAARAQPHHAVLHLLAIADEQALVDAVDVYCCAAQAAAAAADAKALSLLQDAIMLVSPAAFSCKGLEFKW